MARRPRENSKKNRFKTLGTVCAVGVVIALGLTACKISPPEVILYGDSLSVQTEDYFNFFTSLNGQATVIDNVFGGAAPCTWLPQMLADASSGYVSVAVFQFSGNAFSCMSYPPESAAYYNAYQQQVTQAAQAFSVAGVHTFIVGDPVNLGDVQSGDINWDRLNEIYAQIASTVPDTTFVNAGASVEENSQFVWTLPCLPFEPYCGRGGQNPVRAEDGGHFCPLNPDDYNCGDYASGELRFALAMSSPVRDFLSTGSAPDYEGPPLPTPDTPATMAPGQTDPYSARHDTLDAGQVLGVGGTLQSLDGRYTAVLQSDGNFVIYGPSGATWSSGTQGTDATVLAMQSDGNLVLYRTTQPVWATNTWGTGSNILAMQNDGNLVLYSSNGPTWSSGPGD